MDPISAGIMLGVAGNAMWGFLLQVGKDVRSLAGFDRSAVDQAVGQARAQIVEDAYDDAQDPALIEYLRSRDVESIARQLFAVTLADDDTSTLRAAFIRLGDQHSSGALAPASLSAVFDDLALTCTHALSCLITDTSVAAHDAKTSLQFKLLRDEVQALKRLLDKTDALDMPAIAAFEEAFRNHVVEQTRYIVPPYLDALRRVPINRLFVSPQLVRNQDPDHPVTNTDAFLRSFTRAVVLGNPGGGKSTLAQKLAYDIATRRDERLVAGRDLTPAVLLLRDFGARHKESPLSLRDYLEEYSRTVFQLTPPTGAIQLLLAEGRLMLILDGLDELIDTTYRRAITTAVEHFALEHPAVPILVTSREVGYGQAPLNEESFPPTTLRQFSTEQASEYVRNWFDADPTLNHAERTKLCLAFDRESAAVPDLRQNPLMLGLLCNIYRGENWIPRNRPDVYEKCALMLFERWDRQRGIVAFDSFESHLRPAMEHLAHWIFIDQERQAGVPELDLIEAATGYLSEHRYADRAEAEHAAKEFIEFCRGRAWVFTDTGTRASGERLFQFTHRTFLEYFTAVHLARTNPLPSDLLAQLRPRVADGEWDVVSQLALQIKNRMVEGAADELLLGLLPSAGDNADQLLSLAAFATRALAFLVPKPATTRHVATSALQSAIDVRSEEITRQGFVPEGAPGSISGPRAICDALIQVGTENLPAVVDAVEQLVRDELSSDVNNRRVLAAEFALQPMTSVFRPIPHEDRWSALTTRIISDCEGVIVDLASTDPPLGYDVLLHGLRDARWYVEHHGVDHAFRMRPYRLHDNVRRVSPMDFIANKALFDSYTCSLSTTDAARALGVFGAALQASPPPWPTDGVNFGLTGEVEARPEPAAMTASAWFSIAAMVCMIVELRPGDAVEREIAMVPGPLPIEALARVHGEPLMFEPVRTQLADIGFGAEQLDLLSDWSAETVTFAQMI